MVRIIGDVLGALVAFLILWLWDVTSFTDRLVAFAIAVIAGALVAIIWPWLIGLWAARRIRDRRDEEIQKEVQRQMKEQGG
jgi:hypothetical protein